ncbi:MAG TPA: hypothetical protein VNO30_46075 [Kofleriaceae bacterium]|nr:hypothetical protein [Kofleriaceae bacterium]
MLFRRSALVAGSLALLGALTTTVTTVHAVVPRQGRRVAADELTAMPAAAVKPLRSQRMLRAAPAATTAWQRFSAATSGQWRAAWDAATSVPSRMWGPGLPAPGAMASAAAAEQHARRLLADHIALLAPGAAVTDFVLVANHTDGDIRSVGFEQRALGRRVVGGQISFRFKRDRMFMIGSEALPDVRFTQLPARLARTSLLARATDNLRRELDLAGAPVTPVTSAPSLGPASDDEVVLPLVGDSAVYGYRLATRMMIDGGADGRYLAYVDPTTGAVLAVRQQNFYATGTVLYRGVDRYPTRGRVDRIARRAHVQVGGTPQTTSSNGVVSWSPDAMQTLTTTVQGDLVTIVDKGGGAAPSVALSLAPGGVAVWDASGKAEDDAQVVTFLAANTVKDYVRNNLDPAMAKLDEPIVANVNLPQSCNAFYDGKSINFFHANAMCQNTGLIDDVIYHEFGHALHVAEIVEGVGSFDGAMSEGAADFLAASITNDAGMGRGFFYDDKPLRDLDPTDGEFSWPKDISEIHHTGKVFGGTFWDLRKALIPALGEGPAIALVNRLFVGALRRSVSIPTSLYEVLAADDDDGDLMNGTPHECFIRDAFGRHGLRTATGTISAPGILDETAAATIPVRLDLTGLSSLCTGDEIDKVTLAWKPGFGETPAAGEADMTRVTAAQYTSQLPIVRDEVTYYHATVRFKDGSQLTLPDNLGLPSYTLYQGKTVPLYCTSFETDPFAEGWTTGTDDPNVESPWQWGAPPGTGSTDPPAAYSGSRVLGMVLGGDYAPKQLSFATLPPIDVGQWSDVRLQFRRWLAVEDSHYDKARVTVNGQQAWINYTQDIGDSSSIHHIDREWAFHDVRLSGFAFGHVLNIGFDLTSDEGLHLGGWQLDDLCVVANVSSVCGDGIKTPTEACDEGPANSDAPNASCRTYCRFSDCGDEILDRGEECDEGAAGTEACSPQCKRIDPEDAGGCCSSSRSPAASLAFSGLIGLLLLRRRRSTASARSRA